MLHPSFKDWLVEEYEPGVWLVRTATVVPDNERWLHTPNAISDIEKGLSWAAQNPASDDGVETTLATLGDTH